MSKAEKKHIYIRFGTFGEAKIGLPEEVLVNGGDGFAGVAFTVYADDLHTGVIDQYAEQLSACVTGGAGNACTNLFHVGSGWLGVSGGVVRTIVDGVPDDGLVSEDAAEATDVLSGKAGIHLSVFTEAGAHQIVC
jgi:hypothetical protein